MSGLRRAKLQYLLYRTTNKHFTKTKMLKFLVDRAQTKTIIYMV